MEDQQPYVYPRNPHTMTNADVRDFVAPTYPPALGLAPVMSLPLENTHRIVPLWRGFCQDIVRLLEGDSREDDATVLITVKEVEINSDLRDLLRDVHKLTDLYVEIEEGEICLHTGGHNSQVAQNTETSYPFQPPMGWSIGTSTSPNSSGSLGGYVEIFRNEEVKSCALTCDHILKPSPEGTTRVYSPSAGEHEANITRIQNVIDLHKTPQEHQLKQTLRLSGNSDPEIQSKLNSVNQELADLESRIHEARSADRDIGAVFAHSKVGTVVENYPSCMRIDWALVELEPGRTGENKYYPEEGNAETVRFAASPSRGERVWKTGYATKFTRGVINGVEACTHDEINGYTYEWTVLSDNFSHGLQAPFSLTGDSGSFVAGRGAGLFGMLWGGKIDGSRSYFTPILTIAKHILEKTGYHVRLPNNGQHICC